jgi:hypothetical protein
MGAESTIETRDETHDAAGAKSKRQVRALIRALARNGEAFTHVTHGRGVALTFVFYNHAAWALGNELLRVTVEIDAGSLDEMEAGTLAEFARLLPKAAEARCK